jgi:hypothetical protein
VTPTPPVLCPAINGYKCTQGSEIQMVIKYEILISAIFVLTWLIIKHFPTTVSISKVLKPILVASVYY